MARMLISLVCLLAPVVAPGARLVSLVRPRGANSGTAGAGGGATAAALPVRPQRAALRGDLGPVRAYAVDLLAGLEVQGDELPKAVGDLCSACQRAVRFRWQADCGSSRCEDPCKPDGWRRKLFGVNPFCRTAQTVVERHGDILDEHLQLMWNLVQSSDAYSEVCRDLRLCGLSDNALLKARAAEAVELRENVTRIVSSSLLGERAESSRRAFDGLCHDCRMHVGQPANETECEVQNENPHDDYPTPLRCEPAAYCTMERRPGWFGGHQCHLNSAVVKQRALSSQELDAVPRDLRVVSPLLLAAGGGPTTPLLHSWANALGTEQACAVVGLCGNEPGALSRQLTFQHELVHRLTGAAVFFKEEYAQLMFFKDLRATWKATSVTAAVSRELFEMRHFVSDRTHEQLQRSVVGMLQAMATSGFLKSCPRYLRPILSDSVQCLATGVPYGPDLFLEGIAKGFAVEIMFGEGTVAVDGALKGFAHTMQVNQGISPGSADQTQHHPLPDLQEMLEMSRGDFSDAGAAVVPLALVEQGTQGGLQHMTSSSSIASMKAAYTSVVGFCSSIAIYAGQKDYLPYCVGWPITVARVLPKVMDTVRKIKDWRHHLGEFAEATARLVGSEAFGVVVAKAVQPLIAKSLNGDIAGGLVAGAEVLVVELPDVVNFGAWNATLRDARVKAAVVDALRDIVKVARLSRDNFSQAIPMLAQRSTSAIGRAVFQVAAEQNPALENATALADLLIESVSTKSDSFRETTLALLGAPESPLMDLLAESCPMVLGLLMPGLDVSSLRWAHVLRRPEVLVKLKGAVRELEPPLTARGVAGQLLANPALREELLRQATEELAPGFEAMVEHIAGPASDKGVEFLVSAVLARR